jgi:hypothetical protein
MKKVVFWDVAPCGSCVNRRFGGTYRPHLQRRRIRERGTSLSSWLQAVPSKRRYKQDLQGATSQKTAFFIVTAVKTSNLTCVFMFVVQKSCCTYSHPFLCSLQMFVQYTGWSCIVEDSSRALVSMHASGRLVHAYFRATCKIPSLLYMSLNFRLKRISFSCFQNWKCYIFLRNYICHLWIICVTP